MILTKNFTLEELCVTETGLPNIPDKYAQVKLFYLATYILQPIRNKFGALKITSGFRSLEVNQAIGGVSTSQHLLGEAADFIPLQVSISDVFEWVRAKSNLPFGAIGLNYGQAIREDKNDKKWIHISLPRLNDKNQMAMVYEQGTYREIWWSGEVIS